MSTHKLRQLDLFPCRVEGLNFPKCNAEVESCVVCDGYVNRAGELFFYETGACGKKRNLSNCRRVLLCRSYRKAVCSLMFQVGMYESTNEGNISFFFSDLLRYAVSKV